MALWAQDAVDKFFKAHNATQSQCDEIAKKLSGATVVNPVQTPGSMSYTVICQGRLSNSQDLVISFRQPGAELDQEICRLAKEIHGNLVPETSQNGTIDDTNPPLTIYSMPYLKGIACLNALPCHADLDHEEEARQLRFTRDLARYFSRCLGRPQAVTANAQAEVLDGIQRRLQLLGQSTLRAVVSSILPDLEENLPALFGPDYAQVLTHGDLSITNILVDEETLGVTGIVDWSLGAILPFGLDLDCLFLTTGYMDLNGWHDYACRSQLHEAFWKELWSAAGITDSEKQHHMRRMAELAAKLGAVLRYAFQRKSDGSPSELLVAEGSQSLKFLQAWFDC